MFKRTYNSCASYIIVLKNQWTFFLVQNRFLVELFSFSSGQLIKSHIYGGTLETAGFKYCSQMNIVFERKKIRADRILAVSHCIPKFDLSLLWLCTVYQTYLWPSSFCLEQPFLDIKCHLLLLSWIGEVAIYFLQGYDPY